MFLFQNIHVSFLRTVPPYSHQADVWVELLKHLGYRKVIFIHSSDTDGRALLGRFQSTSQSLEDDVEMKVQVTYIRASYIKIILSAIYLSFWPYLCLYSNTPAGVQALLQNRSHDPIDQTFVNIFHIWLCVTLLIPFKSS